MLRDLFHGVRLAFRSMAKTPAFTAIAVLTLALGIGPNTAIFSVIYANLLAPLPYPQPDQLVMLWSKVKGERNQVSPADFQDWKQQASSFQEMAAFVDQPYNLSSAQEPQFINSAKGVDARRQAAKESDNPSGDALDTAAVLRAPLNGQRVSTNWYKLLGEKVWMGRDFLPDDDQPGKDHVFVLSYRCWRNRFASDPNIVGKRFRLNGEFYTVIGVMPPGPSDRHNEEIWLPARFTNAELARGASFWYVVARLKPGVSIARAREEMNAITARIAKLYPDTNGNFGASVEPLKNDFQDAATVRNLWLLLAAVSFVLLIACANVANLLLVRGVARQRELAVRAALGASRSRLIRELLAESFTLAILGAFAGTLLSGALLKVILAIVPPGTLSSEADVRLSLPVLLFTIASAMLSGVFFGCAPAMQAGSVDLNDALKQGGRSMLGGRKASFQRALVALEFALALTLLSAAALTIHSFLNRTRVDLGIRTDHVLTFELPVPPSRLANPQKTAAFYSDLLARIEAVPGVRRAAAATDSPLDDPDLEIPVTIVGGSLANVPTSDIGFESVSPGYFDVLGIHIDRGRKFNDFDTANSRPVAMVNEAFVRRYLADVNPLSVHVLSNSLQNGQLVWAPSVSWQIVGVFHDVQNTMRLGQPKFPQVLVPFAQSPWPHSVLTVRTALDPDKMTRAIAGAVHSLDPDLPLANVTTLHQVELAQFAEDRFGVALYGSLSAVALILAALGIYGVISFAIAQSVPEIGLRIALGATTSQIVSRVFKQGFFMAGSGLLFGAIGSYLASRAMQSSLCGTGVVDWTAFCGVAAILMLAAALACYVPARRAIAVDPVSALRES